MHWSSSTYTDLMVNTICTPNNLSEVKNTLRSVSSFSLGRFQYPIGRLMSPSQSQRHTEGDRPIIGSNTSAFSSVPPPLQSHCSQEQESFDDRKDQLHHQGSIKEEPGRPGNEHQQQQNLGKEDSEHSPFRRITDYDSDSEITKLLSTRARREFPCRQLATQPQGRHQEESSRGKKKAPGSPLPAPSCQVSISERKRASDMSSPENPWGDGLLSKLTKCGAPQDALSDGEIGTSDFESHRVQQLVIPERTSTGTQHKLSCRHVSLQMECIQSNSKENSSVAIGAPSSAPSSDQELQHSTRGMASPVSLLHSSASYPDAAIELTNTACTPTLGVADSRTFPLKDRGSDIAVPVSELSLSPIHGVSLLAQHDWKRFTDFSDITDGAMSSSSSPCIEEQNEEARRSEDNASKTKCENDDPTTLMKSIQETRSQEAHKKKHARHDASSSHSSPARLHDPKSRQS